MPERLSFLVNYLKDTYLAQSEQIVPPLILKGERGVGKSWVLNSLFTYLQTTIDSPQVIPIFVPFQLTGSNLVVNTSRLVDKAKHDALNDQKVGGLSATNLKFLLLMEGIDFLYNVSSGREHGLPKKAIGVISSQMTQFQHARELRSYLIENCKNVSMIATSSPDLRFTEDPDLPFFNFFNVIEVKPLSSQEALSYISYQVKEYQPTLELLEVLIQLYGPLIVDIADGSLALLNVFVAALFESSGRNQHDTSQNQLINKFKSLYFSNISPYVELASQNLSYVDRLLVDELVALGPTFTSKEVAHLPINLSKTFSNLESKLVIERTGKTRKSGFRFKKESFRSWLRFNKRLGLGSA